jgi:hypothetical protein
MRFKPGDLAIVQHSRWAVNNDKIALILAVDSTREAPYQIRRIDGQRWIADGHPHESPSIWAAPRYLRPLPDLDREGWSDWEAIQQLQMQRKVERLLRGEK